MLRVTIAVPTALRGLPREVVVLAAVAFSVAVGFGIVAPAIPLFARQFGVGRAAAGAVISVFAGMRLVYAVGRGGVGHPVRGRRGGGARGAEASGGGGG